MATRFSSSRHLGTIGPGNVSPFLVARPRSVLGEEPVRMGSALTYGRPQPRYHAPGTDVLVSRTDVQRYVNLAHTREMEAKGQNVWQPTNVCTKNNNVVRFSLIATFNRSMERQSGVTPTTTAATTEHRQLPQAPIRKKLRAQRRLLPQEPVNVEEEEEEESVILVAPNPRDGARAPVPEEDHPIIISKARVGVAAQIPCVRPVSIQATTFGPSGPVASFKGNGRFKRLRCGDEKTAATTSSDKTLGTPKRDWKSKSLPAGKKDSNKRRSITMDADSDEEGEEDILGELRSLSLGGFNGHSTELHQYLNSWQQPPLFVPVEN